MTNTRYEALEEKIASVAKQVAKLNAQVAALMDLLEVKGFEGLWLPPSKAAPILGVSEDFIRREIRTAEASPKKSDYKAGIHFRYKSRPDAARPSKLVNIQKFGEAMGIPLEQRKAA